MPRPAALRAQSAVRSGERCADVTSISYAMPNSSSAFPASRMISRSESLPITIETSGLLIAPSLKVFLPCHPEDLLREHEATRSRRIPFALARPAVPKGIPATHKTASTSSTPAPQYPCGNAPRQNQSSRKLRKRARLPSPSPAPAQLLPTRGRPQCNKLHRASTSPHETPSPPRQRPLLRVRRFASLFRTFPDIRPTTSPRKPKRPATT